MNLMEFLANNLWLQYLALVWVLPWKGVALWKAAKKNDQWWFIAILIINTLAILDIIYIFFISERNRQSLSKSEPSA